LSYPEKMTNHLFNFEPSVLQSLNIRIHNILNSKISEQYYHHHMLLQNQQNQNMFMQFQHNQQFMEFNGNGCLSNNMHDFNDNESNIGKKTFKL